VTIAPCILLIIGRIQYRRGERRGNWSERSSRRRTLFNRATNWRLSATIAATIAPTGCRDDRPVYTVYALLVARLNRCSSRQRSPVVGLHIHEATVASAIVAAIAPTVAATIAPCNRVYALLALFMTSRLKNSGVSHKPQLKPSMPGTTCCIILYCLSITFTYLNGN